MLRPRFIPCLLVHNGGLVKTVRFEEPKYVGDPINAVRIFNEKQADELMVLDIDATREGREPDYDMVRKLAFECRMPLAYGGGVQEVEQVERIVGHGVEKVSLSSKAVADPTVISRISGRVGSQSVVVVIDVKRTGILGRYEVVTHNASRKTRLDPADFAAQAADLGAGEIVINDVDRDGTMSGYDLALVDKVRRRVSVPLTVLGGAGSLDDLRMLVQRFGIIGAAAGSLFVFKGKYRAVLINYPDQQTRDSLVGAS